MTQFSAKVQKPYFCPFLDPFCPKSRELEFSQIWDLRRKLANHKTLHFRSFLAKTNDSILHESPKKTIYKYTITPILPHTHIYRDKKEKHHSLYFYLRSIRIHAKLKLIKMALFVQDWIKIIGQKQRINKYAVALEPRL